MSHPINIDDNHSSLIDFLLEFGCRPDAVVESAISKCCLRPEDEQRIFKIPHFCECVYEKISKREPTFERNDEIELAKNIIGQTLIDCYKSTKSDCNCWSDESKHLNGFHIEEIEEGRVEKWSIKEPYLEKKPCSQCDSSGKLKQVDDEKCSPCKGNGYIIDSDNKDAFICNECKGTGVIQKILYNDCTACGGLGFIPKVWHLEYADVICEGCGGEIYFEYGCCKTESEGSVHRTLCRRCQGAGRYDGIEATNEIYSTSYTPSQWKTLSLAKTKTITLDYHEGTEQDTGCMHTHTYVSMRDLREIYRKHPDCPYLKILYRYLDTSLEAEDSWRPDREIDVLFITEYYGIRVGISAYQCFECGDCFGTGSTGFYCPSCETSMMDSHKGIRIYRLTEPDLHSME